MKRFKIFFINTLMIFYIGIMYFSGTPDGSLLHNQLKQFSNKAALVIGIWPSWSMFAPNPVKADSKTFVKISYKNGTTELHDLERKLTGPFSEIRKSRWMKYAQDNVRSPQQRVLLAPIIRHYLFKYNSKKNPITDIQIIRKWREIPLINNDGIYPITDTPRIYNEIELISQKI